MAALIDSPLFHPGFHKHCPSSIQNESDSHQKILKIIKINDETIILPSTPLSFQTVTHLKLNHCDFMLKIIFRGDKRAVSARVCLLERQRLWKTHSKQTGLLLIQALICWHAECNMEGTISIDRGTAVMTLQGFHLHPDDSPFKITHQYRRFLTKNLIAFQQILQRSEKETNRKQVWSQNRQLLQLADILRSTPTNIGICQAKSEFMFARRSFVEQSQQLAVIEKNIVEAGCVEGVTQKLYSDLFVQTSPTKIRLQLMPTFERYIKKLTSLLLLQGHEEKTIEDYNYNVVRIVKHDKKVAGQFKGIGASSVVYSCPMTLVYANSIQGDHSPFFQQLVQRMVAVKRQRHDYKSKRDKIAHEQYIVSKFKNNTSSFLPKYYGAPADPQFAKSILMEAIVGEQLDKYVSNRVESISLGTKLQLLVNIAQGLRQLHSCGVVHLDLKPSNVLVYGRGLKIIDFGEAYHREVCNKTFMPGQTFPWVAPEVILRLRRLNFGQDAPLQFSQKQDVFAFGFIIAEVIFGSRVLEMSIPRLQQVYSKGEVLNRVLYAAERSTAYGDEIMLSMLGLIMLRCMEANPEVRPRVEWIAIALRIMLNSLQQTLDNKTTKNI